MSGKTIVGLIVCVVVIMLVIMLTGYKGVDKETEAKSGYESEAGKAERSFNAKGMDTRLNQVVVHDMDAVKGEVAGVNVTGSPPSRVPSFEVKQK